MHIPKLFLIEPYFWKIKDIDLRPTYRCNAKCPTCGAWKRKSPDLTFLQTIQIIKYFRKLRKIIIEGGEPTLWKHLKYFIKYVDAKEKSLITNAIDTKRIKEIAEYFTPNDMRFVVSLNGIGKTHDLMRGRDGAFDGLVESCNVMKYYKYDIRFQFIPVKENVHELDMVKEFILSEYGRDFINISYPSSAGIYGENIKCTYLNAKEMHNLFMSEPQGKLLNRIIYDIYTDKAVKQEFMPCLYGRSKIHIRPDGGIATCQYEDNQLFGQAYNDRVIIDKKKRKHYCKKIIPNKCQYLTGQLCSHEAVCYSIRHNFFYLSKEIWKRLI